VLGIRQQGANLANRQANWLAPTCGWRAKLLVAAIALMSLFVLWPHQAQAQSNCVNGVCLTTGSRLTSVDSQQGVVLDALLSDLLGADLNLTALDANGLAQGSVGLEELLDQLQLDLGVATPGEALTTDITLGQLLDAAAVASNGNISATLESLAANLNLPTDTIQLGDLLQIDPASGSLSDIDLNALDLLVGSIQLFNRDNIVTTPNPIVISGADLGLGDIIGSITLQAQVVEAPLFVCGPTGTQFYSAGVRLKLAIDLIDVDLDDTELVNDLLDGLIGGLLNVGLIEVDAKATVGQLDLYVDVARGSGTIGVINAVANAVTIEATPGVADLYLGSIPDADFFNRTKIISSTTDLGFGNIASVNITVTVADLIPLLPNLADVTLSATIGAKSFAEGGNPTPVPLNFSGPYPQTLTAETSATFVTDLVQELLDNLALAVTLNPGTSTGALGDTVSTLLNTLLPNLLDTLFDGALLDPNILPLEELLTEVVDPLLEDLGIALGEMDVTVNGLTQICTVTDTDGDSVPDATDLDDDGDGIIDSDEGNGTVNTDGDGQPDSLDTDSDNDSVPDVIEGHDANHDGRADRVPAGNDTDLDGLNDAFDPDFSGVPAPRPDTDGDGKRDFQDANDDNDAINTINEDANNNGTPTDDDTDADGRPNYLDVANTNACIPDANRPGCAVIDTDNDGIPNQTDGDDDGDGILDTHEGNGVTNTDGDNTPDSLDSDSDNDNVPDRIEGHDANHDGQPDRTPSGSDTDGDGVDNIFDPNQGGTPAPRPDTDADGKRDFQDPNDDNDVVNTINEDANNNGNPTDDDTDADGRPNYLDINNSNPCIPNANRPGCNPNDTDQDGIPDSTDTDDDGDGVIDSDEGNGTVDTDGDSRPDSLDTDSDNDSVPDATEAHDADHNGQPDRTPSGSDTDGDGIDNAFDTDQGGTPAARPDTDEDGAPDFQDANDDNDAINTINEDADSNGTPTNDDTDGDEYPNYLDIANGDACVPDANAANCNPDPTNPCVPNANAVACPTGDTDDDDTPNGTDPAPLDPCIPNPNALACTTGDPDDDDTPNGTDPAPLDPCIPNPNALACDNGDSDEDDMTNDNDPSPTNPCVPNANAIACSTGDTDNDGTPNGNDPAPLNPCIPNPNSAACISSRTLFVPIAAR